jgi:polyferredoxin
MDACDSIMDGIGRPRGLIRYSSRDELAGQPRRMLRPRVIIYPLLLAVVWGALAYALLHRAPADVTVLRGIGSPFTVTPSGMVMNQIRVKIVNRDSVDRRYQVELVEPAGAPATLGLVAPENPLPVPAGKAATAPFFVTAPRAAFDEGRREVQLRVDNGAGWSTVMPYRLLGPGDEGHEPDGKDKGGHEGDRGR